MGLSVSRSRIKEKCAITGTDYDSTIDNLIAEIVPVVEYLVRVEFFEVADAGLAALLNLAATEIVAGELLAQLHRAPGASERVRFGDIELTPQTLGGDLFAAGWSRIGPFLKDDPAERVVSGVRAARGKSSEEASS